MITIYWHCIDMTEDDEEFVARALEELAQRLRPQPIKLNVSPKRLKDEPDLARKIDAILDRLNDQSYKFIDCASEIMDVLSVGTTSTTTLLVYCLEKSDIVQAAKSQDSVPSFGMTRGQVAIVYEPFNKFIIWHEALHTLGADDCYDENKPLLRKPDCNSESCIMQYQQSDKLFGEWAMRDKNIRTLQALAKRQEHNA